MVAETTGIVRGPKLFDVPCHQVERECLAGFEQRGRGGNAENSHLSCRNVLQAKIVARIRRGRTWRETWTGCRRQGCERIIKRTHQLLRHCHHRHSVDSFTVFPWRISFLNLKFKSRDLKQTLKHFFLYENLKVEKLNILKLLQIL